MAGHGRYRPERKLVAERIANELKSSPDTVVSLRKSEIKWFRSRSYLEDMMGMLRQRIQEHLDGRVYAKVEYTPKRQRLKSASYALVPFDD